jgi:NAD kinase
LLKKIPVEKNCTWFVQAILEDTGIVAVSLGGQDFLTIYYDKEMSEFVNELLTKIYEFCKF